MLTMYLEATTDNVNLGRLAADLGSECTIGNSGGKADLEGNKIVVRFPDPVPAPSWNQEHPMTPKGMENTMQRIATWGVRHNLAHVVNGDGKETH